ncbi:single-stranded DNA-binding protein [Microbacterium sp. 22179]|uniref:single-stranded DNA-binding protein n=1 Tax=Microbacterium sp. 22179 TaxID=3453886 RepID=UPI003F847C1A
MMDTVTIVGKVATEPNQAQTGGGVAVTNFRLASTHRRFDQSAQAWVDSGVKRRYVLS